MAHAREGRLVLDIAVLFAALSATAQAWTPPLGIPAPSFGIEERADSRIAPEVK